MNKRMVSVIYRLCRLNIKSGVVSGGEDFEQALHLTEDRDFYNYKLSREERVRIAASILVSSSEYVTLSSARYLKNKSVRKDVIQMVTRQFIEKISEDLGINLNDDYDFFENLSNHLASVFQEKNVSYPENPEGEWKCGGSSH